jgi:hypothetical protein
MFNARKFIPHSSAVAGETVARVGDSRARVGAMDMAHRTASLPIYRGVLR